MRTLQPLGRVPPLRLEFLAVPAVHILFVLFCLLSSCGVVEMCINMHMQGFGQHRVVIHTNTQTSIHHVPPGGDEGDEPQVLAAHHSLLEVVVCQRDDLAAVVPTALARTGAGGGRGGGTGGGGAGTVACG